MCSLWMQSVVLGLTFWGGAIGAPWPVSSLQYSPGLEDQARQSLKRGIEYFASISTNGGYVYYYSLDLRQRWGESRADENTIEVQSPGTPAVGSAFLRAYHVTGDPASLEAARQAASALIRGQNGLGGWEHTINFSRGPGRSVSFDDDQTQGAIRFLIAVDQVVDDASLEQAIEKALKLMLASQMENGAWPHRYPREDNYHDFATFNDGGINDCIRVMLDADRAYKKPDYQESLRRAARFLKISQLPPPQPGWAQQYNEYLQPAWARSYEPPAVCPTVTLRNVETLMDLSLYLEDPSLLELIPDALEWVRKTRLPNGNWPRFVELYTDKPLYYDRGRIRVNSPQDLHIERRTGYGYEQDLSDVLAVASSRFQKIQKLGREAYLDRRESTATEDDLSARLSVLELQIRQVIASQDQLGRWVIENDRFRKYVPGRRWAGEYEVMDRISARTFCQNVHLLCDYLSLVENKGR